MEKAARREEVEGGARGGAGVAVIGSGDGASNFDLGEKFGPFALAGKQKKKTGKQKV